MNMKNILRDHKNTQTWVNRKVTSQIGGETYRIIICRIKPYRAEYFSRWSHLSSPPKRIRKYIHKNKINETYEAKEII